MSEESLPPCKECHKLNVAHAIVWDGIFHKMDKKVYACQTPRCKSNGVYFTEDVWRLLHTPDPIIAELKAQVHELEKLLDESHVVAAALDTELRALKAATPIVWGASQANQEFAPICKAGEHGRIVTKDLAGSPIWDSIANGAQYVPESALKNVPTDGASKHDKYLYGNGLTDTSGPERRITGVEP